jgi:hypothetical protein
VVMFKLTLNLSFRNHGKSRCAELVFTTTSFFESTEAGYLKTLRTIFQEVRYTMKTARNMVWTRLKLLVKAAMHVNVIIEPL